MRAGPSGFWRAAQAVLRLRADYPDIRLIMILPYVSQDERWPEADRREYQRILSGADRVVYTGETYGRGCFFRRDRYLVDHSGACICYLDKNRGGTAYTVSYAHKRGLAVINIADLYS